MNQGPSIKITNTSLKLKKQNKYILQNINAVAFPGRILAIMGKSGEGKSSLLSIVAGRLKNKNLLLSGQVKINGSSKISKSFIQRSVAYVPQENLLYETLTVRETFELAALLKLDKKLSKRQKLGLCDEAITLLGLSNCRETVIGAKGRRGISGGERKRTSMGSAMITDPEIFLLDEPTTGLDTESALNIVLILKKMASRGKTVILTIHQPNSEIFSLLDDLLLLACNTVVYNGPASLATAVFSSLNHVCPKDCNPSDFFLNTIHAQNDCSEDAEKVFRIASGYQTALKKCAKKMNYTLPKTTVDSPTIKNTPFERPGLLTQFWEISKRRTFKNYLRNLSTSVIRLITILVSSLLIGTLFFRMGKNRNNSEGVLNVIFFITLDLLFNTIFSVVLNLPSEKEVFFNETSNGMYSPLSFYLSKLAIELPIQFFFVLLYLSITLWMTAIAENFGQFISFVLVVSLGCYTGYAITFTIGIFMGANENAISLVSLFFVPSTLFSGFFINTQDIKVWLRWVTYLNFYRYYLDLMFYIKHRGDPELLGYLGLENLNVKLWGGILVGFITVLLVLNGVLLYLKSMNNLRKPIDIPLAVDVEEQSC